MADNENLNSEGTDGEGAEREPVIRDKRRIDPETGDVRQPDPSRADTSGGPADAFTDADQALLDQASIDLVAEMRSDMLRAQAELVNFRQRVERDRAANRDRKSVV